MLGRPRIAVSVIFALHGAVTGTFATRIPWIAEHLHTDPGGLGLALLFGSLGAMVTMPLSGRLVHRMRARLVVPVFMVFWCLAIIPAGLASSVPLLGAAMLLFGAAAGAADVA